jgi:hypothetical protein
MPTSMIEPPTAEVSKEVGLLRGERTRGQAPA